MNGNFALSTFVSPTTSIERGSYSSSVIERGLGCSLRLTWAADGSATTAATASPASENRNEASGDMARSWQAEKYPQFRSRRRSEEHTSELQSPCNIVCR